MSNAVALWTAKAILPGPAASILQFVQYGWDTYTMWTSGASTGNIIAFGLSAVVSVLLIQTLVYISTSVYTKTMFVLYWGTIGLIVGGVAAASYGFFDVVCRRFYEQFVNYVWPPPVPVAPPPTFFDSIVSSVRSTFSVFRF